uniref:Trm112 family protein n=1 Tax=Candidatus Methanosuratincola petrocarbonis (ex Vanwonterghem et al. 2016) TaxID=1867261 RepID=A0A7J3V0V5_9CREN
MKRRLLDILACPMCRHHPLDLRVLKEEGEEIEEGALICGSCKRWYPIIETIPHMLPDEMRKAEEDLGFMEKWKGKLPTDIVQNGKPFNLGTKK